MTDTLTPAAVDSSVPPPTQSTGRAVLRWLGWTLLLCAIYWGSSAIVRLLFGDKGWAPAIVIFACWVAGTFLIGMVYRSKAWPLSPLAVGIGIPIAAAIFGAVYAKVTGATETALITLVSLAALLGLAPLALVMAGVGWLGVVVGNRRATDAVAPGTALAAREPAPASRGGSKDDPPTV